jgi:hypothetical protein
VQGVLLALDKILSKESRKDKGDAVVAKEHIVAVQQLSSGLIPAHLVSKLLYTNDL